MIGEGKYIRPRVLFVLKCRESPYCDEPYSYGGYLSSGLLNSARLVAQMLERRGFPAKLVQVPDNNAIHREIVLFNAEIVIIEAFWVVPQKFNELQRVCPNVRFIIRNHSNSPFLANEGIAMDWTLEYVKRKNVSVAANAPGMLAETRFLIRELFPSWSDRKVNYKAAYLPNWYPTPLEPPVHLRDKELNVGCFGAIRPLKNQLLQAIAAMKVASDRKQFLKFHINGSRIEGGGSQILKNIVSLFSHYTKTATLVLHPWLDHGQFLKLLRNMDIVTQISFSETFNIVSADATVSGIPVVGSDQIPWLNPLFHASTTDFENMVEKMHLALARGYAGVKANLSGLADYNLKSESEWLQYLTV